MQPATKDGKHDCCRPGGCKCNLHVVFSKDYCTKQQTNHTYSMCTIAVQKLYAGCLNTPDVMLHSRTLQAPTQVSVQLHTRHRKKCLGSYTAGQVYSVVIHGLSGDGSGNSSEG